MAFEDLETIVPLAEQATTSEEITDAITQLQRVVLGMKEEIIEIIEEINSNPEPDPDSLLGRIGRIRLISDQNIETTGQFIEINMTVADFDDEVIEQPPRLIVPEGAKEAIITANCRIRQNREGRVIVKFLINGNEYIGDSELSINENDIGGATINNSQTLSTGCIPVQGGQEFSLAYSSTNNGEVIAVSGTWLNLVVIK